MAAMKKLKPLSLLKGFRNCTHIFHGAAGAMLLKMHINFRNIMRHVYVFVYSGTSS